MRGADKGDEEGKEREQSKWEMVMELVHTAFRYGVLVEEATYKAVVLILKGGDEYHGIGLVEVLRKAATVILNCRFAASITYHDSLHGFQAVCGTGTVTLEVKPLQQVTAMREEVLHTIFMDLHKAYNSLDMSRCL